MNLASSFSLKIKITAAVVLLAAVMLFLQMIVQIAWIEGEQRTLFEQQLTSIVQQSAREIEDKLELRLAALEGFAITFPTGLESDIAGTEAYLRNISTNTNIFDDLYIFSARGELLADWPVVPGRRKLDMSDRDYIRHAVLQKRPYISEPVSGRITNRPIVILSAPLFDKSSQVTGVIAGVIDLQKTNILGDLKDLKIGETGCFLLVSRQQMIVMHPVASNLLKSVNARGQNATLCKELLPEPSNSVSAPSNATIAAHARLPELGWSLSAIFPLADSKSSIKKMIVHTMLLAGFLVLLVISLIWWTIKRFLAPLESFAKTIRNIPPGHVFSDEQRLLFSAGGGKEVQELASAFDDFMQRTQSAEEMLMDRERRLSLVLEAATDGIWDWNIDSGEVKINEAAALMLDGHPEAQRRTTYATWEIRDRLFAEERPFVKSAILKCLQGESPTYDLEHRIRRSDGRVLWVRERGKVVEHNAAGTPLRMIGSLTDITAQKQREEHIRDLASFDPLTRLPNRRLISEKIADALAASMRTQQVVALMFLDLDHFKNINDSLGHSVGDTLLQEVATRLKTCVDMQATVARQGGDEFVILLPETDRHLAKKLATEILQACLAPYAVGERMLSISMSIGISLCPDDATDVDTLFRHADMAMYAAKAQGRNSCCFFSKEMDEKVYRRHAMEMAMQQGLLHGEFFVHYQPQLCLRTGQAIGVEALLRWHSKTLGNVSPNDFIPVAERSGLILQLGAKIMLEACIFARKIMDQGARPIVMSVNVSAAQFRRPELPVLVGKILKETGLPPHWLELEVTEGVLMEDLVATSACLIQLRQMGVRLAIDDFGTGYSSLAYLKTFPFSKLKIDRSFVVDLNDSARDRAIVCAIVSLADSLGLTCIAEGVEEIAQRNILRESGCDEYQGYLASPALSPDECIKWLAAQPDGQPVSL